MTMTSHGLDAKSVAIGVLLAAAAFLAIGQQPNSEGKEKDVEQTPPGAVGRYQVDAKSSGYVVIDTRTGEVWERVSTQQWYYGTPKQPTYRYNTFRRQRGN